MWTEGRALGWGKYVHDAHAQLGGGVTCRHSAHAQKDREGNTKSLSAQRKLTKAVIKQCGNMHVTPIHIHVPSVKLSMDFTTISMCAKHNVHVYINKVHIHVHVHCLYTCKFVAPLIYSNNTNKKHQLPVTFQHTATCRQ